MQFRILTTLLGLFLFISLSTASIVPRTAKRGTYKALYDFASQATDEVDLRKGEVVTVIQQDASGWWLVEKPNGSAQGWTPASYLSKVSSGSSSTTSNKKTSASLVLASFSTKKIRSSSYTIIKRPSHSSTSSRTSISARPSSKPSSAASSPISSRRSTSSTSAYYGPFVLTLPTGESSYLMSTSSVRTVRQGFTVATGTSVTTRHPTSGTALNKAPATSAIVASANVSKKSSMAVMTGVPVMPTHLNTMNVSSTELHRMVGSAPTMDTNASFPMKTAPVPSQISTSNSSNCLVHCDVATSAPIPKISPADCLVNCESTNSSLVNATTQGGLKSFLAAAVPAECADPGGVHGITTACWNSLDMSRYVIEWTISHHGLCQAETSFAQCFLEILDIGMVDCVSISSGTCPPPSWIQFKDHHMSVRDFYLAYNIYAVWTFFNSYYLAIGNARSAATDSVAAIVALLNPPKTDNAELSNINFALGIGLTFLKIEGFLSPVVDALVGIVVNAAKQIPQVVRYLFPGPPGDTKFIQLGQISNQMGTLTDNLQNSVATALSVIQNDTNTFLSFTGTGAFSNNPVVRMNQQSNSLLTALNTYVISLCLQANNWQISRAIDTDVNQLMANGTKLTWNITECGTGYNENSICGAYYWNKTIDVSYTLTNTHDMFQNPAPIMQQFFANWTTPQLLFDGALECQMAKGTGNPNISPIVSTNDVTKTPCLSSVKICTWDLNPSHFGTQFEYVDCDVQDHFATQGCTHCDATVDFCTNVPSSYLGGYLLNPQANGPLYAYCNDGHTLVNAN